jgi:YgiT-type zinc finger domain-containing protein
MNCVICKSGQTRPGSTTLTLQRGPTMVVFKSVPGEICDNCGEAYISAETSAQVLSDAEQRAQGGVELEVHHFAAPGV